MDTWLETKARLTKKFPALLSSIETKQGGNKYADNGDRIVDQIIFDELSKRTVIPPYDPYLVENLINSSVKLLDRCANYRTALYDIEGTACKQALDYQLFNDQLPFLETIELAAYVRDQNEKLHDGNKTASTFFSGETGPLNKGFSAVASATADSSKIAFDGEALRQEAVKKKWEKAVAYQKELESRHSAKGHALNFGERFDNIRVLLIQDICMAYDKLRCIEVGAKEIFRSAPVVITALPPPSVDDYLGKMVYWIRALIDELEKGLAAEFEFVHVVHLRTPRTPHKGNAKQRITTSDWNRIMAPRGTGLLTFNLADDHPEFPSAFFSHLRLIGIGVAYSKDFIEGGRINYNRLSAIVFPPTGAEFFSVPGAPRAPIILETVSTIDKDFASRTDTPDSIQNIDPRGTWSILVSPNVGFCDNRPHLIQSETGTLTEQVTDIKLVLRLRAIASSAAEQWSGFDY
ncbi:MULTISPECIES: hypothetical protein [unclassified Mesorhizobium]|uniref:hypothetical protein n=1 Tax=unclassified Mesorhizobium TaxID=325217 RepID=UPI00112A5EB1|nr:MULTISPECIES: hypothetical protein [unclassified Mesorhizobium]TPK53796.1 hypothetical protein FJ550_09330 [Mesorhizobium sp. B2-5-2]TPL17195.1 hypothetical protein FJ946_28950 [Mesorhizobium sp. B2-4-7]TPL33394.1 hypothetical protein FJ961_28730 [Mesorhizobium sp. B2-4-5]TPM68070.1 hypothetical protein FJ968_30065 [Mesorhizobium sp. B2-1-6]TPN73652.1 hypothetical protein FJ985_25895 [Mesorhizobium sp. B1-1-2]